MTLTKVLEAATAEERAGKGREPTIRMETVVRVGLPEALESGRLEGVPGVYALFLEDHDRPLVIGSSPDIGNELRRHVRGETSGILELLAAREKEQIFVEAIPLPDDVRRRIYDAAREVLSSEFNLTPLVEAESD